MGRYDKVKVRNEGGWIQPSNIKFKAFTFAVRYIYIYQNGSNYNTGSHLCQVEAYTKDGVNVALGKTVTGSHTVTNPQNCVKDTLDITYAAIEHIGRNHFIIDLGQEYELDYIKVWRYYDGRTYYESSICCTNSDLSKEVKLHDYSKQGLYTETESGFLGKWIDLGDNNSSNTRTMNVFDGISWLRKSLNKKETQVKIRDDISYGFGNWSSFWPLSGWGARSNATYFSQANFNCNIPEGYAPWNTYTWDLINSSGIPDNYGWASSNLLHPNVWRHFYFRWPNHNKWLHNIVMQTVQSSLWQGCPSQTEVWAGDRVTYIGTYGFTNPGGQNTDFWFPNGIDYKPNGGIKGIALSIYDGVGWKRGDSSLRMKMLRIEGGDATTTITPVYETVVTWE